MLPKGIAKQLILTGEPMDGRRAYELVLLNELASGDDRDAVLEAGQRLADAGAGGPGDPRDRGW